MHDVTQYFSSLYIYIEALFSSRSFSFRRAHISIVAVMALAHNEARTRNQTPRRAKKPRRRRKEAAGGGGAERYIDVFSNTGDGNGLLSVTNYKRRT